MASDASSKAPATAPGAPVRGARGAVGDRRRVLRNPLATDIFADALTQLEHLNGTVRMEFAILKPGEPPSTAPRQLVQVARVMLPEVVAQRLCLALYDYLKREGLDPMTLVSKGTTPQ